MADSVICCCCMRSLLGELSSSGIDGGREPEGLLTWPMLPPLARGDSSDRDSREAGRGLAAGGEEEAEAHGACILVSLCVCLLLLLSAMMSVSSVVRQWQADRHEPTI